MRRRLHEIAFRLNRGNKFAISTAHPNGHYYSPVVDPDEIRPHAAHLWPQTPTACGVDFNDVSHQYILREVFPKYLADYDYPERLDETRTPAKFYTRNSQFSWLDARALFVLLREWRPRRVIEVGSGYSTLLMADVNRRFLDGAMELTCIEPHPRPFLRDGLPGMTRLVEARVQDLPLDVFEPLGAGDVLFIDSSHVAKTGSDVNHLYLQVLPRLRPGVRVHIHDIPLPAEYPREWVLDENRSWNEQYLVHALLMFSSGFRVTFGCSYAWLTHPDLVRAALAHRQGTGYGGGSLWIERT